MALAVLGAVYFGLQWRGQENARVAEEAKRLFDFSPADVTRLELKQIERPAVAGERVEGGWDIKAPNDTIPPFNPLWDRVAEHLANLMNERSLEQGSLSLEEYGLDIPALELKATAAGREIQLAFGKLEPTQEKRYALMDGEHLFLVHKNAFYELNRSLDDLRNKFTVDDREATIVRVEFAQVWQGTRESTLENPPAIGEESPQIALERDAAGAPWRIVEPVDAAANQDLIDAVVKEMQFAVGRRFIDNVESLSDYGLQPPRFRITMIDDKTGTPQTFFFGNTNDEGGLYVQRAGRDGVFVMDPEILRIVPTTPDQFQERRLLTHQALDFDRIVIWLEGQSCELRDDPEKGWRVLNNESFDTDQAAVSTYITALKRASGEKIIRANREDVGLAEPETRIQLFPRGGGDPVEIRVQSQWEEEGYAIAQQDLGAIMTIPVAHANALQVDCTWFRSRRLWQPNPGEVNEVRLHFEGVDYHFRKAHGVWAVLQPANLKLPDNAPMDNFLGKLAELRVVTPKPEEGGDNTLFGFDPPLLRVTLTAQAEEHSAPLTLGPLEVGGVTTEKMTHRYVRVANQAGVYRLEQKWVDATRDFVSALQPK